MMELLSWDVRTLKGKIGEEFVNLFCPIHSPGINMWQCFWDYNVGSVEE